jgi:hypothetical protein
MTPGVTCQNGCDSLDKERLYVERQGLATLLMRAGSY